MAKQVVTHFAEPFQHTLKAVCGARGGKILSITRDRSKVTCQKCKAKVRRVMGRF